VNELVLPEAPVQTQSGGASAQSLRYQEGQSVTGGRRRPAVDTTARALGWLSIGIAAAELLMPRLVARAIGARSETGLMLCGLRELAIGIGILESSDLSPWVWGRVAGDALDAGMLAFEIARPGGNFLRAGVALAGISAITAADIGCALALKEREERRAREWRDYSDRSGFPLPPAQMAKATRRTDVTGGAPPPG
jgi:hypothetical protein